MGPSNQVKSPRTHSRAALVGTWVKEWRRINGHEAAPSQQELMQVMRSWLTTSGNSCPRLQALRGGGGGTGVRLTGMNTVLRRITSAPQSVRSVEAGGRWPALPAQAWRLSPVRGGCGQAGRHAQALDGEGANRLSSVDSLDADTDDLIACRSRSPSRAPSAHRVPVEDDLIALLPQPHGPTRDAQHGGCEWVDDVRVMGARLCHLQLSARNRTQAVWILRNVLGMQVSLFLLLCMSSTSLFLLLSFSACPQRSPFIFVPFVYRLR